MSDRVEERRQDQVYEQKKQQDTRTAKEKAAAGEKFKSAIASNLVAKQSKTTQDQKKQGEQNAQQGKQQGTQQSAFMARQGIVNRSQAEQLMRKRDDASRTEEKDTKSQRDKDVANDRDRDEVRSDDQKQSAASSSSHDAAIQRRDEESQQQQQQQGQGGQQGQQQQGQQQSGDQRHRDDESTAAGGIAATAKKAGAGQSKATEGASGDTGKVVIGKTEKMSAAERIPPAVLEKIVSSIQEHSKHGMNEFIITFKEDVLGGGSVRVTMGKDEKMKVVFTMKEPSAKNLLESSKGKLMRMLEMQGLALESLEVKVRGQA